MSEIYSVKFLDENKNITGVLHSNLPIQTENDYEHEKSESFIKIEERIKWNANDI